ncbi:hypothetical protein [Alteromonas sp. a30]|uniref:hypothetical protein n=1 Tax=Alteromonas sp. a30 TaxID=2730917 RepID=UPI00228221E7|nr:hypothetical protein [Alteromonas sp. a30]MCY7297057.1 hypothetical protein [Alteromonas sp. a30]
MNTTERREFYEKLYFHELEVREKLEGRLKLPMTIFAIVTAMVLFLFNEIIVKKSFEPDAFFLTIYGGGVVALVVFIFFFVKSWYGYTYKMVPNAVVIENYFQEISEHYNEVDAEHAETWSKEAFEEYLLSTFRDYAAHNTVNNDRKSYNLYKSITALIIAFSLFAVAYYPYYNFIHQQSKESYNAAKTTTATAATCKECQGRQTTTSTKTAAETEQKVKLTSGSR